MQTIHSVGFVGAGNLAGAIIKGLLNNKVLDKTQIWAAQPDLDSLNSLQMETGIQISDDNTVLLEQVDLLVLSVKPQVFPTVWQALSTTPKAKCQAVMSVMAGVPISRIQHGFASHLPVVRAMPNMASQVGLGCTGLIASPETSDAVQQDVTALMQAVGEVLWLKNEAEIDAVTAISGSGPAYFFYFIEALELAAKNLGFSQQAATLLARQTALGAATIASDQTLALDALRAGVTSKGGTTAAALAVLAAADLPSTLQQAVQAAATRATQLSQE